MQEKIRSLVAFNLINELQRNPALLERFSVENICELALRNTQKDGPITEDQIKACHKLLTILETVNSEFVPQMNSIMSRIQPGHKKEWPELVPESVKELLSNTVYTNLLDEALKKVVELSKKQIERIHRRDKSGTPV
jgi:hypothetical protein